jgi:predicted NodU family carbamoyl transferase
LLAGFKKPKTPIDITYGGMELLDKNTYPAWIESNSAKPVNLGHIATELANGKIFGCARGRCEHGPRALGNRSIFCNPAFPEMKDILNFKVKNREWYRPFAPVCKLEDVSKYFEWEGESRHMLYCPTVKKEWKEKLSSITHIDGTARVQTVTREQNEFLYDLITAFEDTAGHGVLLNTSFNIAGKPILNTISDAMKVLESTQMDYLIIEDFYYGKHW